MRSRQNVRHNAIERFAEKAHRAEDDPIDLVRDGGTEKHHFARFMKMAAARKQQILERILLDD